MTPLRMHRSCRIGTREYWFWSQIFCMTWLVRFAFLAQQNPKTVLWFNTSILVFVEDGKEAYWLGGEGEALLICERDKSKSQHGNVTFSCSSGWKVGLLLLLYQAGSTGL